jgi:TonB family protein
MSRRLREVGVTQLRVRVSASGEPLEIQLATSSGYSRLDDAARSAVVAKAADALRTRYIFPEVGEQAAVKIEGQLAAGAYKDLSQSRAFADKLTADLQSVTRDKHMRVSAPGPAPAPNGGAAARAEPPRSEGGIVRAHRLAGHIG